MTGSEPEVLKTTLRVVIISHRVQEITSLLNSSARDFPIEIESASTDAEAHNLLGLRPFDLAVIDGPIGEAFAWSDTTRPRFGVLQLTNGVNAIAESADDVVPETLAPQVLPHKLQTYWTLATFDRMLRELRSAAHDLANPPFVLRGNLELVIEDAKQLQPSIWNQDNNDGLSEAMEATDQINDLVRRLRELRAAHLRLPHVKA